MLIKSGLPLLLALGVLTCSLAAAPVELQGQAADQKEISPETVKKLKIAWAQHEMIMLLIENKSFDKVLPELQKILDLKLTGKYEDAVVKSTIAIANKLAEAKQLDLAHKALDEAMLAVASNASKANLLRFKAYLFKEAGAVAAAIETFRRANELETKQ